jgi:hypothetical protein
MAWRKTILAGTGGLLLAGAAMLAVQAIQARRIYPGLAGVWEGTYFNQRVALKIARTDGKYLASFDYIDFGIDIPADRFKPGKSAISFRVAGTATRFAASLDPAMTQMSGHWRQGTNNNALTLKRMTNPDMGAPLTEADYAPRVNSDVQGIWKGTVQAGPRQLAVTLKIAEPSAGNYRAEMDRVEWGGEHIPASSITREGDTIKIGFHLLGNFEGRVNAGAGQLAGDWTEDGKPYPVVFGRMDGQAEQASKSYTPAGPLELQGHWKGTLELPNGQLHFVFHIAKLPDGSVSATMDNPDQGANNILATTAEFTPPKVSIMWGGVRGVFNGALKNGQLTGTWRQRGAVHPLTLSRDPY